MKISINILIIAILSLNFAFAQEAKEDDVVQEKKEVDKPVRDPYQSGYLIDNQTTFIPVKGTFEIAIQHKFGLVNNGFSDLFGIYAPGSNIRLGLTYTPFKNVQVGYGITKKNVESDFNVKWTALEQTRSNSIPVAVALYANMAINGNNKETFGTDYKFSRRFSYFSEAIVSRKINDWLTLQAAASFTHYNTVDSLLDHDKIGFHFGGRVKFSSQGSFIFNYDIPLKIKDITEQREWGDHPEHNLNFGIEIATSTHVFQVYLGTADGLLPQDIMMYNQNEWNNGDLAFGFTITRSWNF